MELIEKVKNYVENNIQSVNLKFGENLYINHFPDTPDVVVTLVDLGGYMPPLYTPTREKIIEFKFRASNYTDGMKIGNELFNLFHDEENYHINNKRILHSFGRTDVSYLYKDNNDREEFSLEVVFLIQNKKD